MTNTTQRTHATEGTQAHNDIANVKANIKYLMHCQDMTRAEAQAVVKKVGYKMLTNEEINRAVTAEAKRQAALKKRAEKAAEDKAREEAEEVQRAAAQKKWEQDAKKAAEEPKAEEPKAEKKINQKSIGITVNGVEYPSICKGMAAIGLPDKGTKNWFKIRAGLKKSAQITVTWNDKEFIFIQL
jgi:hypothetical protein